MPRAWFLQANPSMYDIDRALDNLDVIWWRIPQYTSEVRAGDVAVIWRSGPEAGVVGIGRLTGAPRNRPGAAEDADYYVDPDALTVTTQAPVQIRRTEFVPKSRIEMLPEFADHQIVTAPMGTVFPIDAEAWGVIEPLVADPPEATRIEGGGEVPPPFAWEQRGKSVHPMPGGYDSYLTSLAEILERVSDERPTRSELPDLVTTTFDVSATRSKMLASFLTKVGFLEHRGEQVGLSEVSQRWLASGDPQIVVGLLHGRVRYIGELLEEARSPKTTGELLEIANNRYGVGWSTQAQIDRRRGWLQSAGMLTVDEANRMSATEAGVALLRQLSLHAPSTVVDQKASHSPVLVAPVDIVVQPRDAKPVISLVQELNDSATDISDPDRFERAVREAFAWLGFEAEWLGGSGQTDVLLDAPLGLDASYRVIVDCKTSKAGSVSDQQIDWITLAEHRRKHDADHVAVVGPQPSGRRLFQRAAEQGVTIIAALELAALCEQHAHAPLDLEAYRSLFEAGGTVSTDAIAERAEDWLHVVDLSRRLVDTMRERCEKFGALDAAGLQLLLADDPLAESASRDDIQAILSTLSGGLFGLLSGDPDTGYRLTTPAPVARTRLEVLAYMLFGPREETAPVDRSGVAESGGANGDSAYSQESP